MDSEFAGTPGDFGPAAPAAGFGARADVLGGGDPAPATAGTGSSFRDTRYDGSCVSFASRLPLPCGVSMLVQVPAGTRLQALP